MAIRVKRLNCRVSVRSGGKSRVMMYQDEKRPKPSMQYAVAPAQPKLESTMLEPSATAAKERGAASGLKTVTDARRVDPKAVADRVYDLMMKETTLARMRGESRYRGNRQ